MLDVSSQMSLDAKMQPSASNGMAAQSRWTLQEQGRVSRTPGSQHMLALASTLNPSSRICLCPSLHSRSSQALNARCRLF